MSALASIYLKKEQLESLLVEVNKIGEKGLSLTIAINDNSDKYGNNISVYHSQSKEEIARKAEKRHVANGRVFYTKDGTITTGKKQEQKSWGGGANTFNY